MDFFQCIRGQHDSQKDLGVLRQKIQSRSVHEGQTSRDRESQIPRTPAQPSRHGPGDNVGLESAQFSTPNMDYRRIQSTPSMHDRSVQSTPSMHSRKVQKTPSSINRLAQSALSMGQISVPSTPNMDLRRTKSTRSMDERSVQGTPSSIHRLIQSSLTLDNTNVLTAPGIDHRRIKSTQSMDNRSVQGTPGMDHRRIKSTKSMDKGNVQSTPSSIHRLVQSTHSLDNKSVESTPSMDHRPVGSRSKAGRGGDRSSAPMPPTFHLATPLKPRLQPPRPPIPFMDRVIIDPGRHNPPPYPDSYRIPVQDMRVLMRLQPNQPNPNDPPPPDPFFKNKKIFQLNYNNFTTFLSRTDAALVLFYSKHNLRSRSLAATFSQAACLTKRANHAYAGVNCDDNEYLCKANNINRLPTVRIYSRDRCTGEIRGDVNFTSRHAKQLVEESPNVTFKGLTY